MNGTPKETVTIMSAVGGYFVEVTHFDAGPDGMVDICDTPHVFTDLDVLAGFVKGKLMQFDESFENQSGQLEKDIKKAKKKS